jgi:voltage-gated potassium channel
LPPPANQQGQANHAQLPYGIPYESEFHAAGIIQAIRDLMKTKKDLKWFTIILIYVSALHMVYSFAIVYIAISHLVPHSFTEDNLDPISGLYFSIATFATVGFGDIAPIWSVARLVASLEIIVSMGYVAFLFASVPALLS